MATVIASLGQTTIASLTNTTAKLPLRTMSVVATTMDHPIKVNLLLTECPW